jgi:hypothetical protein
MCNARKSSNVMTGAAQTSCHPARSLCSPKPRQFAVFERFRPGAGTASWLAVAKRIVVERIGWAPGPALPFNALAVQDAAVSFLSLRLLHNVVLKTWVWRTYEVPWISFISQSRACCILRIRYHAPEIWAQLDRPLRTIAMARWLRK